MSNKYVRFGETIISQEAQQEYASTQAWKYDEGKISKDDLLEEVQGGWITWAQYDAILASGEEGSHDAV